MTKKIKIVTLIILLASSIMFFYTSCTKSKNSEPTKSKFKGVWNRTSGSATTAIAIGCVAGQADNYIFICEWDTPNPDEYYGTIDESGIINWQYPEEYQQYEYKAEVSGNNLNMYAWVNGVYHSAGNYVKGKWPDNHCNLTLNEVSSSFTVDISDGPSPLQVKFTNTSTNATSYLWDFGDGTTSTDKDPIHIFTNPSLTSDIQVTVKLWSMDSDGNSAYSYKFLTVRNATISPIVFNPNLSYDIFLGNYHSYKTITIGTQTWMAENLQELNYRNYDAIQKIIAGYWQSTTTGGFGCVLTCGVPEINSYGFFYNWYAVNDSRNIAPVGWHVPSDSDWTILSNYLGGETIAGGKLKEIGTYHWKSPNTGSTNESGFSATGSELSSDVNDTSFNRTAYFWSRTESNNSSKAWAWKLSAYDNKLIRVEINKNVGMSVRLVKD